MITSVRDKRDDSVCDGGIVHRVPKIIGTGCSVGRKAQFNVDGKLCATQADCPHKQGPLVEGELSGSTVTCPWHGSQFDVSTGAVLQGPATEPLKTYPVQVEGDTGRIEIGS